MLRRGGGWTLGREATPKAHLNVVQLGPISCHDVVGASLLESVTHNHSLGCLPWRFFSRGTEWRHEVGFQTRIKGYKNPSWNNSPTQGV